MFRLIRLHPKVADFSKDDLMIYEERIKSTGRQIMVLKERLEALEDLVEIERSLYLESQQFMMDCCLAYAQFFYHLDSYTASHLEKDCHKYLQNLG